MRSTIMKVLSIGNSFSQDAHHWLHELAYANDYPMETVNLFRGGCSLERHWNNILQNKADYDFELNGGPGIRKATILEALEGDTYDVITLQQVSHKSGFPQTYLPYITLLAETVRQMQPHAKLYFHQVWAYEYDHFAEESFKRYVNPQDEMHRRIVDCSQMVSTLIHVPVIPSGELLQKVRTSVPEFDYRNGGLSLCRDGAHLSLDYGRYLAAAVWLHTLTGQPVKAAPFRDFDSELLRKIVDVVNAD